MAAPNAPARTIAVNVTFFADLRRHLPRGADGPQRYELPDDATITGTGTAYDGLDRYEARTRMVADLDVLGDLVGLKSHEMVIGRCQRSHDVVEPRLKTQWFVRTGPLAAAALIASRHSATATS